MEMKDRIKEKMQERGYSQDDLALRVGVSQTSIYKVLNGLTRKPRFIGEIAGALGVSVEWLLTGKDMLPPAPPDQASNEELPASPQEVVLLGLFRGLTDDQKTEIVRSLEAQKQQNKVIWEQLSKVMGKK
ncbi:helix-turn-helix domain-containing protein [Thiothrix litoralis]|uniref:Helix-turn-helix domain-containing protein n=1 Tax=Thiothrix litoralis TaxID=2891210 RepID=A0ABX7WWD0_9GAMM|nr:helix-turn-helix domain-containing protein [Thiothrix litoralis]QTR47487.1 helix-turn-helix domain-containing protein [Thiothrix litoralis]